MENPVLASLEPRGVFRFFEELTRLPHGSGNTAAASGWVVKFAEERGLKYRRDELGNVIVWKDASPGYEDHPAVILQGHLDMVCVQEAGMDHDFEKDPLELEIDGDWVKARGTTLGGDDGAAAAIMMALMDGDSIAHPPIEAVFTVDEEIGLLGAAGLDCSDLKGRKLINLDSEEEGIFTVGCAGGSRCDLARVYPTVPGTGRVCRLVIQGLLGGHSGVDIGKGRANANKLLAQALSNLPNPRLISLYGGEQDNAIPNRAEAVVLLSASEGKGAAPFTGLDLDPALESGFSGSMGPGELRENIEALSSQDSREVIDLLLAAPNGIQAMEPDLPGQVKTSLNLGILRLQDGALNVTWSVRSSAAAEKEALVQKLQDLAGGCGASFNRRGDYPAWAYRPDSVLRDTMVRVHREQTGKEPQVVTIHAGLECGLFSEKLPGLDAVSMGPDMQDIHSAREKLSISSMRRTWAYVKEVLRQL